MIAEAFYLTKDIEKYGSGYIRIRKEIKEYPSMTFEYKEMGNGFIVHLKYNEQKISTNVPKDDPVSDPVNDRQKLIIDLIKKDRFITRESLANVCNISLETIKRDIRKLRKLKIVKRVGSDKTGYWEITENKE